MSLDICEVRALRDRLEVLDGYLHSSREQIKYLNSMRDEWYSERDKLLQRLIILTPEIINYACSH